MLYLLRMGVMAIWMAFCLAVGMILCLIRPRHKNNTYYFCKLLSYGIPKILNLDVEVRNAHRLQENAPCVMVANHQTNYDLFIMIFLALPGAVSLGKKEIFYYPVFGQFFWLSGNILINRGNKKKAMMSMEKVKEKLHKNKMSVLIMPEGTRSKGRGLLPFKRGAFHTAIAANVPIVPVCASSWIDNIDLNRWYPGKVILDVLPPIPTEGMTKDDVSALSDTTRKIMLNGIKSLEIEFQQTVVESHSLA